MSRTHGYKHHRFPPEIIARAVWLYFRFPLSHRLVEEMLLERAIAVCYETIRRWGMKFGPSYARRLRSKQPSQNDIWHLDEVVFNIGGQSIRKGTFLMKSCNRAVIRRLPSVCYDVC